MKVVSVNVSQPQKVKMGLRSKVTGIFKKPITEPLFLAKEFVKDDHVQNKKHHGGLEKACFVFSTDHYDYWKSKYPNLDWDWGMFGENISISDWDESVIRIGDVFKIGEATIQCSQPRIPCSVLAYRFEDKHFSKEYLHYHSPGTYWRVLEEGNIRVGDELQLLVRNENSMTILELYRLVSPRTKKSEAYIRAMNEEFLSSEFKESIG